MPNIVPFNSKTFDEGKDGKKYQYLWKYLDLHE